MDFICLEGIPIFATTLGNGTATMTSTKKECPFHGKQHKVLI
jgi:acyl CoA:acetate/3-ketoacid CoA transferase alpha subunit